MCRKLTANFNIITINESVATIHVKNKREEEFKVLVSIKDIEKINKKRWYVSKYGNTFYAYDAKGKTLHRELKGQEGMVVDHINRNSLDNRDENLRVVTKGQNQQNTKVNKLSKTGIAGVTHCKGKYKVQISVKNKTVSIGTFKTIEEASVARKEAEKKLGWINVI